MIYTLTLNPAVDWELQIDHFELNSVSRSNHSQIDCGGKGFNVSRMLRNLKTNSVAMGFVGGKNGERLESGLQEQGVATDFTWIKGESRTNVSIVALDNAEHIKVNEPGPTVNADEIKALTRQVESVLVPGDWWVLAGSLPPGVPPDIYADFITIIENAGANVILDTSGEALGLGCKAKPFIIKPNIEEAQHLMASTCDSQATPSEIAKAIQKLGPKNVVISLGKEGAIVASDDQISHVSSPSIIEANPIGAGDAMVGGLVWGLSQEKSLPEALQCGIACGAATASQHGTDMGTYDMVLELLSQIQNSDEVSKSD